MKLEFFQRKSLTLFKIWTILGPKFAAVSLEDFSVVPAPNSLILAIYNGILYYFSTPKNWERASQWFRSYEQFWLLIQQIGLTKTAPLLVTPIEMRVLWTEMKCIQSASRLLNRDWVNKGSLDLSKEVLWVFEDQRARVYRLSKLEVKANSAARPSSNPLPPRGRIFFWPPTPKSSFVDSVSVQESRSTIYVFHLCSKYPHFNRSYQ